jgi:hypothetical protein
MWLSLEIRVDENPTIPHRTVERRSGFMGGALSGKKVCTSAAHWRAFDKAVRKKPPVVAADAGPMHIQLWEGAVPRFA